VTLRAGLLAIATLVAIALAGIGWLTRAPPAARRRADPVPVPAAAVAPGARSDAPNARRERATVAPAADALASRPPARAVDALMPAQRRQALRSFRLELKAGLAALAERVAGCAAAAGPEAPASSRTGASFTLEMETVEGGVRIVDARADGGGEAEVTCARAALLGAIIPAPSAEPGRRWPIAFAPRR
jgi:hypothetical protein